MQNDLLLVTCLNPNRSCAESALPMARLAAGGTFELLSATAWTRALGYRPEELHGKYLRELIPLEPGAASEIVAGLLDTDADTPVDMPLRCKDRQRKHFRFYRRVDERAQAIFVIADEFD